MIHPSDTPPDGDFARYVERLAGGNTSAGAHADLFKPAPGGPASARFSASSGIPSVHAAPEPFAGIPFLTHVKWVFVAWIATQLLARLLPGAGFLFIPCLLAYAAWVVLRVNAPAVGAWAKRLADPAEAAAKTAGPAQGTGQGEGRGARGAAKILALIQPAERKHPP